MIHNQVASIGFIILFPGYVVYNYGVVAGFWPSFVGGLFGISSIVFSFFGIFYLLKISMMRSIKVPILESAYCFYLSFILTWTLCASIIISQEIYFISAVKESMSTIVIWLAVYYIAVGYNLKNFKNHQFILACTAIILLFFLHAVLINNTLLGLFIMFGQEAINDELKVTYQGLGRSILATALVLMAFQKRCSIQIVIMVGAIIMLLGLGSRAHLFSMILVTMLTLFFIGLRIKKFIYLIGGVLFIFLASLVLNVFFFETRAAEIFDLKNSTSWQARAYLTEAAVSIIIQNPISGSFAYYMHDGTIYAHNILSAWTQYGLIGFFLYIGLLVFSMWISLNRVFFNKNNPDSIWMLAFQFNLIAIILAVASEPINGSVFPALAWGFTVQALRREKQMQTSVNNAQQNNGGFRFK